MSGAYSINRKSIRDDCINNTTVEGLLVNNLQEESDKIQKYLNILIITQNIFPFPLFSSLFPNSKYLHLTPKTKTRPDPDHVRSSNRRFLRKPQPPSPDSNPRRGVAIPAAVDLRSRRLRLCSHGGASSRRRPKRGGGGA